MWQPNWGKKVGERFLIQNYFYNQSEISREKSSSPEEGITFGAKERGFFWLSMPARERNKA